MADGSGQFGEAGLVPKQCFRSARYLHGWNQPAHGMRLFGMYEDLPMLPRRIASFRRPAVCSAAAPFGVGGRSAPDDPTPMALLHVSRASACSGVLGALARGAAGLRKHVCFAARNAFSACSAACAASSSRGRFKLAVIVDAILPRVSYARKGADARFGVSSAGPPLRSSWP